MDLALPHPSLHSTRRSTPHEVRVKTRAIALWMIAAIALVATLAFWDEDRESSAALADFAQEQTTLAGALAASLAQRLEATEATSGDASHVAPRVLLRAIAETEHAKARRVLVARPGEEGLVASDGAHVRSAHLEEALSRAATKESLRLSRPDAAALDLPERTAMAGIARFDVGAAHWAVVVVTTAEPERDRERRAAWRLVLGVTLAAGLVVLFGGLAMRTQRNELELAHRLALANKETERDERLVRADKLATMGALASGVAHEVSTPLGVILGRAEQLLPKQPDERSRRAVESIVEQSERISTVVRGFLALARGGEPSLSHTDPASLARAAIASCEHRFEKAQVDVHAEIAGDLPRVACDARLFEQVLVNLLLNACDACEGGGNVELSVKEEGDQVAFVVEDDGVGISPADAARATEPFFTTKPQGKGTGLGLAISNEIVHHHRGVLTIAPRSEGRGTRAVVVLPKSEKDHG